MTSSLLYCNFFTLEHSAKYNHIVLSLVYWIFLNVLFLHPWISLKCDTYAKCPIFLNQEVIQNEHLHLDPPQNLSNSPSTHGLHRSTISSESINNVLKCHAKTKVRKRKTSYTSPAFCMMEYNAVLEY